MVSFKNLALVASSIIGLAAAAPTEMAARQTFVPGTQNNTQEFYLKMFVTDGLTTYTGYSVEAWHTGAGTADPVFVEGTGSPLFLNGTNLQFDVSAFPFSFDASPSDTNYARWEPVYISSGYGTGVWYEDGSAGFVLDDPEFGGWLVCEWFHGINAPQLFQVIKGFNDEPYVFPSSCARVVLLPQYF